MRSLKWGLLATALFVAPAYADVILDPHLSGTGNNVVTESVGTSEVVGGLNGQNIDLVDYTDLTPGFASATSGNDIKIDNTTSINWDVVDPSNNVLGTTTQVFSLKGTGDVTAFVTTNDGLFSFDLGTIGTGQSGFTFTAINNEVMLNILLTDSVSGGITDFEHNRIDLAVSEVPIPATLPLFASGLLGLGLLARRKRRVV